MSQLADIADDFERMVTIAVAHLQRAEASAPDEWSRRMVECATFNARRTLPTHKSALEQREGR